MNCLLKLAEADKIQLEFNRDYRLAELAFCAWIYCIFLISKNSGVKNASCQQTWSSEYMPLRLPTLHNTTVGIVWNDTGQLVLATLPLCPCLSCGTQCFTKRSLNRERTAVLKQYCCAFLGWRTVTKVAKNAVRRTAAAYFRFRYLPIIRHCWRHEAYSAAKEFKFWLKLLNFLWINHRSLLDKRWGYYLH